MAVWGKILGAFFGFLLGGPIGLILGLFLGHKFDTARHTADYNSDFNHNSKQQAYFHLTFAVMGHLAKAKGKVTEQEIRLASELMDRMELQGQVRRDAQDAFREGKDPSFPLQKALYEVRRSFSANKELLQFFLEVQIQAAIADGQIHPSEYQVLLVVAKALGFSRYELDMRVAMQQAANQFHQQGNGSQGYQYREGASLKAQLSKAYKILGVDENTDLKLIKRAYLKLMNEHHPDKLAATGLPPEMMEIAKQKTQEIQAAYDLIKKEREH